MSHLLITSGPTREYLDPVRYLSNGSSGKMGRALADAALKEGFQVTVVSGPVDVDYPCGAVVHHVVTTEEMLKKCREVFPDCDLMIGAAAPCDFRPKRIEARKITKNHEKPLKLELVETEDIVAELGTLKKHQTLVAFALETHDHQTRAIQKLQKKNADYILLNDPQAIQSDDTEIKLLDRAGAVLAHWRGSKSEVAQKIIAFFK